MRLHPSALGACVLAIAFALPAGADEARQAAAEDPPGFDQLDALALPLGALAQNRPADSSSAPAAAGSTVRSTSPDYSASMSRLQEAAQRLRESIQAMAQQAPGEARNRAIDQAHQALYDTQSAMIQLPPELRSGAGGASQSNYTKSMERLQQAAQKLRESVQAMAQQPAGERRNAAAREAREALLETQQAMVMLPPDLRTAGTR